LSTEEKHLSAEQIDALVETQPGGIEAREQSALFQELRRHLAACEFCQRLVSVHEERQRMLDSLRAKLPGEVTGSCPSEESLRGLAGGTLREVEASEILNHVLECDHCGPLLRREGELLNGETSHEEAARIALLESSKAAWQGRLARRLAGASKEPKFRFGWIRLPSARLLRWAFAGATLLVCVVVGVWLNRRSQPSYAQELLATAYSESRTMELRVAGGKFAPVRVTRGKTDSNLAKPVALLEAETLIGKELKKNPGSRDWLAARGRADLLDANYDSAIDSLERAVKIDPTSTAAEGDLASAYFLRGEATNRPIDYGTAMDLLGKALGRSPDDPVLRFNRAIISEKMFLYAQALEDWEHYLRIDPSGPWASEAQQRLAALKERFKKREQSLAEPLLKPGQMARLDPEDPKIKESIGPRMEEYYRLALREWLPLAYPAKAGHAPADNNVRQALSVLAGVAAAENHDRWLRDLLASDSAAQFPLAVEALSDAVRANEAGNYLEASTQSARARGLFTRAKNEAGALRSRVEGVYAIHLSHHGELCLEATAEPLGSSATAYPWLGTQFAIERAICRSLMGDLGSAQSILQQAIASAGEARYPTLYLRSVGNAAEIESGTGNVASAWSRASDGLSFFWQASLRPMQGYNLYVRLGLMAEQLHRPHLRVAIWREALVLIDSDEDYLLRAMAHSTTASAAWSADMPDLARKEFAEAERLFALAPDTDVLFGHRIEAGTMLAAVEVRAGRLVEARGLLEALKPGVDRLSNDFLAIQFYSVLGEAQRRLGQTAEAEKALRSAVALAEVSLASLGDEKDRVSWSELSADSYLNLTQLTLDSGDSEEALELWEWYRAAASRAGRKRDESRRQGRNRLTSAALAEGPALPELKQVRQSRAAMETRTVVSYAVFNDEVAIWLFDNRGVESKLVKKPAKEVDSLVSRFVDLCSDSGSDPADIEKAARPLYDLLIVPIANSIRSERTLIVETDKSLSRLPVGVLTDHQGRFLSDFAPLIESVGVAYGSRQRSSPSLSARSSALIVGVAIPAKADLGAFHPAVEAETEAREIAEHFLAARLLIGEKGTLRRVREGLPKASIFHFAGHAVASETKTGLVLSDNVLSADTLDGLPLAELRLVVLSGCETQNGSAGSSADYDSLVRIFLRAGVPELVASRWKVDSGATSLFMQKFYGALMSGKAVTESMREARRALRDRRETSHPYYWGAFANFAAS
jgi:CHAT domain-containing protein